MTHEEIMAMPIEGVSEKRYLSGTIEILFHIKECSFNFSVRDTDKKYYLGGVYHQIHSKMCLFCYETWENQVECRVLGNPEIKPLLFERLIESNSIRLKWLYRQPKLD